MGQIKTRSLMMKKVVNPKKQVVHEIAQRRQEKSTLEQVCFPFVFPLLTCYF